MAGVDWAQEHANHAPGASGTSGVSGISGRPKSSPSVRFEPVVEKVDFVERSPEPTPPPLHNDADAADAAATAAASASSTGGGSAVTPEQIASIADKLGATDLQGLRVANFNFEPVSLPTSRSVSHETDSRHPSGQHTPSSTGSPMLSAKAPDVQSPPLTPAGTAAHLDAGKRLSAASMDAAGARSPRHSTMTTQRSGPDASPPSSRGNLAATQRPSSSDESSRRPFSSSGTQQEHGLLGDHRKGLFSIGPVGSNSSSSAGGKSLPVSREVSPSRKDSASQFYTRPFTPAGEPNDPYAANRRAPQNKIEPRFVFSKLSKKRDTSPSSSSSLAGSKNKEEKRHSGLFGNHHHHHHHRHHQRHHSSKRDRDNEDAVKKEDSSSQTAYSQQGSMSDLRRFFKLGPSHHTKIKRAVSPAVSVRSSRNTVSKSSTQQIPFGDEHTLTSKYGKLGKILGSGAGGSVRLMKRSEDNTVFAVKEFRARHTYETEKDYVKKLTAEYCIGSSLHHGNIIETLDIINEKGKWYEVMEYAPYDLFAIVMTGRMTRAEIACCFLQILSGVTYLHSMGLAHRDMKLDNVVVSEYGIMKIIDFGSAHVFKYPFESGIVLASGIVGSDPYLAPEVYDERKYDPTAVDIWSLAIIFCCMTLRRFPWKVPRLTDNSYKLFAAEPTPGHDPKRLVLARHPSADDLHKKDHGEPSAEKTEKANDVHVHQDGGADGAQDHATEIVDRTENGGHLENEKQLEKEKNGADEKHEKHEKQEKHDEHEKHEEHEEHGEHEKHEEHGKHEKGSTPSEKPGEKPAEKREVIRGPWRILRLLPRESRHVIGGMLAIDPKERIKMHEILQDPWVANTIICRQTEPGRVIRSTTHTHILEQPTPAPK
ncbi:kinase-like protein [Niveomyces insectorum RCEF 264]|uniref:non-specific serine/threonine protein kinase n=1 Tax=Niveomyces insectorum RCEF 264 TaxID=1081102 RepID=A0A168A8B2_9HYPO|nr:kinase-like protein [Niveomyces insectorum RCEF 264]